MGKKLAAISKAIKKDGSMAEQMRFVVRTGMSLNMVEVMPDSPENVKRFSDAYKEILGKNCPIT
jgi:hypothetical protein